MIKHKTHNISFLVFALTLVFGISGVPNGASAQDVVRAPTVTVYHASENEMIGRVPISGTLVAKEEVLIYPQISGFPIEQLNFDIGDTVKKGDVLALLNTRTLTAQQSQSEAELTRAHAGVNQADSQILSAKATLTQAKSVLSRAEQLRSSGSGSQASLDQAIATEQTARAALDAANDGLGVALAQKLQVEAQLEIANINLAHATIRAPVEGLITLKNGRLGAISTFSDAPIYRLIASGIIEVEAEIVETAMSEVDLGDDVSLDIAGIGQKMGEVRLISPVVDPVTRLGKIRISLADDPDLRPGLFSGGWIITERRTSLTVPVTAILSDVRGAYVLAVNGKTIERREVVAGLVWEDQQEVLSGLSLDDVVVARAGAFFADGDIITPVVVGAERSSQ